MTLSVAPITISQARSFVARKHSHHGPPVSGLFAVSVADGERVCCVAIVGRPVSRVLDAARCAEVTREASDGTRHAASMCLGAAVRAPLALGYRRIVSYTILGEAGTSYRAAGWHITGLTTGREWSCVGRPRAAAAQPGDKVRWETGPDAMPADGAAALVVGMCVGRIAIPAKPAHRVMPLFPEESL